ncbi:MAG: adenylate/guanylate cyclase domain-containing protein [Magnetococcales bacterium]|nr:adenylate/guanylate cyclase domain-containing protein [Magnetococcales bacterium]
MKPALYITDIQTGKKDCVILQGDVLTIGRSDQSDIVINSSNISRNHARLLFKKKNWFIEDCGSSNGTYIKRNGIFEKITGKQKISKSTIIRLSNCKILNLTQDAGIDSNKKQVISSKSKKTNHPLKSLFLGLKDGLNKVSGKKPTFNKKFEHESPEDLSMMIPIDSLKTVAAIIVLDQCDSSGIANSNEQVAYHLKKRLKALTDKVMDKHPCRFYENTGDGFLGIYDDPNEALQVARKISNLIKKRNGSTKNPDINFRLALHYGEIYSLGTGVHGNDLNIAFRIEGVTADAFSELKYNFPKKDRTLCSSNFLNYFKRQGELPAGMDFQYCGPANLKGISDPMDIFQIIYQD